MKNKDYVIYKFDTWDRWGNVKHKEKKLLIHHGNIVDYVKHNNMYCSVGYYNNVPFLHSTWTQKNWY